MKNNHHPEKRTNGCDNYAWILGQPWSHNRKILEDIYKILDVRLLVFKVIVFARHCVVTSVNTNLFDDLMAFIKKRIEQNKQYQEKQNTQTCMWYAKQCRLSHDIVRIVCTFIVRYTLYLSHFKLILLCSVKLIVWREWRAFNEDVFVDYDAL